MTISLITVNHYSERLVATLVADVGSFVDEVIVVDNGSDTAVLDDLKAEATPLRLLRPSSNIGYGAAVNLAAREAAGDTLVLANPDLSVTGETIKALVDEVGRDGVALVAPRLRLPEGRFHPTAHRREPRLLETIYEQWLLLMALNVKFRLDRHPTAYRTRDHERVLEPLHVSGALLAIDAAAFRKLGGFDERFFLYREETDLCRRLRDRGWRIRYIPWLSAEHTGGGTANTAVPTGVRAEYLDSNYRYIAKHDGMAMALLAWTIGCLAAFASVVTGPFRRAAVDALRWHLTVPSNGRWRDWRTG